MDKECLFFNLLNDLDCVMIFSFFLSNEKFQKIKCVAVCVCALIQTNKQTKRQKQNKKKFEQTILAWFSRYLFIHFFFFFWCIITFIHRISNTLISSSSFKFIYGSNVIVCHQCDFEMMIAKYKKLVLWKNHELGWLFFFSLVKNEQFFFLHSNFYTSTTFLFTN